jgi:hypothetical protein
MGMKSDEILIIIEKLYENTLLFPNNHGVNAAYFWVSKYFGDISQIKKKNKKEEFDGLKEKLRERRIDMRGEYLETLESWTRFKGHSLNDEYIDRVIWLEESRKKEYYEQHGKYQKSQ